MDPESGLDGLRNIGIAAGRIAALSTEPLRGERVLDVRGLPFTTGGEHPRRAGNFARLPGHYVREKKVLSLMEALAKISWQPARRLETQVPAMARKGRIKVGADADITWPDSR